MQSWGGTNRGGRLKGPSPSCAPNGLPAAWLAPAVFCSPWPLGPVGVPDGTRGRRLGPCRHEGLGATTLPGSDLLHGAAGGDGLVLFGDVILAGKFVAVLDQQPVVAFAAVAIMFHRSRRRGRLSRSGNGWRKHSPDLSEGAGSRDHGRRQYRAALEEFLQRGRSRAVAGLWLNS